MSEILPADRMARILKLAIEEVLGEDSARLALPLAPGEVPGSWMDSLECAYGLQPGRGIALRIGRACFAPGLREYGEGLGLTGASFRLLPSPAKLKVISAAFGDLFRMHGSGQLQFERSGGKLLWHVSDCPLCRGRKAAEPACQLGVGLAEEALYWLSGGKVFQVEETACIARGDPHCTIQVDEAPLS